MEGQVSTTFWGPFCLTPSLQDEAFSIWSEWALLYRPQSDERLLLERVRDERWLVSIVHHDYRDSEALWTFIFDETSVE